MRQKFCPQKPLKYTILSAFFKAKSREPRKQKSPAVMPGQIARSLFDGANMQPAADLDISKTPAVRKLHPLTVIPLTHQIEDDGDEIDLFSWLFCGFLALLPFAVLAFLIGLFD